MSVPKKYTACKETLIASQFRACVVYQTGPLKKETRMIKMRLTRSTVRHLAVAAAALPVAAVASTDYGPAQWAYPCCNYSTSGYGKKFYVEHDMEGYFWPSIVYLSRCSTSASIHYDVNGKHDTSTDSSAGHIVQQVRDAYYAWHVRCWNHYMLGTEHEGFASNPAWFTDALYSASGTLTGSKCTKYGISKNRDRVIGHYQKKFDWWRSWMYSIGYSSTFVNCNTHSDPGPYWNWTKFMGHVTGTGSTPSAPSTLTVSVYSSSRLDLHWKDNSSIETGFKVERSTSSGSGFAQIGTTAANDVTYSATSLASGTKYYFRVRAYNSSGNSGYSGVASGTTKDVIPAAPTGLTATASNDDVINLAWACSAPNEDGFRIYRSTDGTNYTQIATKGINSTSYSNTGLTGNRKYWYKVYSYNTAGNSAASNVASDTTAPQAPSALTATAGTGACCWNTINLAWTDNANAEVGFKIERATASNGTFTQIATNAASDTTYSNTGLSANVTYWYRVRTYNANGNSLYSNLASSPVGNAPPVLTAIGNKTVASGTALTFTATASDPNATTTTTTWQTFQSFGHATPNETVLFNKPLNSATTSAFIDTVATNYTQVFSNGPSAWGTTKSLKAGWTFKTGLANYWVRLNTFNTPTNPNPTIALDQKLQFKFYPNHTVQVGLGVRETGTTAAYGANGGTTGVIEWVGVTNVISGNPIPNHQAAITNAVTLSWDIPFEPTAGFTGDGIVPQNNVKGVLEHVIIKGLTTGAHSCWFDDFAVVAKNNNAYTLDAGAPAGASIGYRNGKFSWTPSAGQVGVWPITVRVTDRLGAQDFETIQVTVTGTGNAAPVLAAIGNKTVKEGLNLAFTATATDANAGQTLTFSLDAGNPSGSSIGASTGAFSWTPTEAQGPGSYPITVRVTDNGSPVSNDFETVTVTVQEVNTAPTLAAIADQTINEGSVLSLTASGSDSADVPANALTYTIAGPVGMTINSGSGAISWTPGEEDGGDVDQVTVTVKDNGSPALSTSRTFNVTVNEVNSAPVVTLGSRNDYSPLMGFDELDDEGVEGHNNATGFRVPYFSSSTTAFLDSTSYSYITNDFPRDEVVNNSYQALYVQMNFKTGTVNPWCRLTSYTTPVWTNKFAYPNPVINLAQHVRFKVWSDKSVKVAIGVRETGSGNPLGFDGGITGTIEWVGATSTGSPSAPVPTTTIPANAWTQVDINIPTAAKAAFSGNGVIDGTKGTLEHIAIVPNGGMGFYNMYIDDVEALIVSTANPLTIDTLDTVTFTASATDVDRPAQDIDFTLTSAPTNATISMSGGVFEWTTTPEQSPSTNVITVTATDNGTPVLTGSANLTVIVNKVNTPPRLEAMADQVIEGSGTFSFDANAQDDDLPAQTLTYSLTSAPAGASINSGTGTITWTPPAGNSTNTITVRVTDNGTPALWDEQSVTVIVAPGNTAPTLSLSAARATEPVVNYETFTNGTPNEQVMFKKPSNSSTTSAFIDTTAANSTSVTTSFPANANAGAKVMRVDWTFKTGITDYWVRLTTGATTFLPNPTINASARLKVDVYSTKSIKVALGIRETGTTAVNGADGGTTGTIEFVGAGSKVNGCPQATRTVAANTWTTLEFDLPNEPKVGFTGDGILNGGQQVLEHLALVGTATGAQTVYLDNFQVVTTTTLPGTVNMKTGSTLTFTASGTDPDPGAGLLYGIDADFADLHTNAVMDADTGAFSWTPTAAETASLSVSVEDQPTNGGVAKTATSAAFSIVVATDTLGPKSAESGSFVAGGDTVTLTWEAADGASYELQSKSAGGDWASQGAVSGGSVTVTNDGADATFRIVEVGSAGAGE